MYPVCKVKNIDTFTNTYCGQALAPSEVYQVQDAERVRWSEDDHVLSDIVNQKLQVGNGDSWFTTSSGQIDWLKAIEPRDIHGKLFSHETTRPIGTTTVWTGEGDDVSSPSLVGGGQPMSNIHAVGNPVLQQVYVDFNIKQNQTFIHECYVDWKNCNFDTISGFLVPKVTSYSPGSNTNYQLYPNYLYGPFIIAAAGNGDIQVAAQDIVLVEMPVNQNTGLRDTAFWNADYDAATDTYSNITFAAAGDGQYNMFSYEYALACFLRRIQLLGDGNHWFQSADAHEMGQNMRIRLDFETNNGDHEWKASVVGVFHRAKTV